MLDVITKYCKDNTHPKGLFLLDMPTGIGKTHDVLDFIYNYATMGGKKTIFFVTPLLKNLPIDDLKKRFEENNKLDVFNDKFLKIESNMDRVIDNLGYISNDIPKTIKNLDEYKNLEYYIYLYNKMNSTIKDTDSYLRSMQEQIRTKLEPEFRKKIIALLDDKFSNKKQKLKAITEDEDWTWLGKLYPTVFTSQKKIIFLSIDKFILRNDTLIEPSYLFYESDIIKESIIFIDEFDSTKNTILNRIIENGLHERFDSIDMFLNIYNSLNNLNLPKLLTTESTTYNGKYTLNTIIENFKNKAEEIYTKYHMDLRFKTKTDLIENQNFLFHDHEFHTISGKTIYFKSDIINSYNYINIETSDFEEQDNNMCLLLGSVTGFLSYFKKGIKILAQNFLNCKNENIIKRKEDFFTFEEAVRSVLHEFCSDEKYVESLTNNILVDYNKKDNFNSQNYDLSFYEKGFQYYDFKDDHNHDLHSKIMQTSFTTTPEKILLSICDKAKVIGISATATLPCVTYNYDVDYLKSRLNDNYHILTTNEIKHLKRRFEIATSNYNNVKIKAKQIDSGDENDYNEDLWFKLFKNKEYAVEIYNYIENQFDTSDNIYDKQRYFRIACAYYHFAESNNTKSFLCLLNKYPKDNDVRLDKNVLEYIFNFINVILNKKEAKYEFLYPKNFEESKDNILKRLSNGEKIFVISVYQSIGAGQNLQYKIPNSIIDNLIKINNDDARPEKDFDAIYLDCPTNVFTNLSPDLDDKELCRYIFQIEYLQQIGEISEEEALTLIKNAYTFKSGQARHINVSLQDTNTYKNACTRVIIQAIGRICRTNMKNKKIYIYYDKKILDCINPDILKDKLINNEMNVLLNEVKKQKNILTTDNIYVNKANINNTRSKKYINKLLNLGWTNDKILEWKKLRELTLKFPTISESESNAISDTYNINCQDLLENFYVKFPSESNHLYYSQKDDFDKCFISFNESNEYPYTVSADNARLQKLLKIKDIDNVFEKNNYAKSFKNATHILSPIMYNNIYKGALGEVVGLTILNSFFGNIFEEIVDIDSFELFDFKVKNKPIYIDMKHWTENTTQNNNETLLKISNKLNKCNGNVAIIINLLSEHYFIPETYPYKDKTIIQIPCLYKEQDLSLNMEAIETLRKYLQ